MMRLHGLDLSYYTGKVQAYLRARGIAHVLVEMDSRAFARCARHTGVAQMPQLELPDGIWLTDSTRIIETLERALPAAPVYPRDPALCFVAHLLEDFADEWLWRPAMAYRWVFAPDARQASERLARGLLRDVPLPLWARRAFIRWRQRHRFLRGDGVNPRTQAAVLAVYPDLLQVLEELLGNQPFILGARPTQADFGFFGSMFRHFASDPTPAAYMHSQAPAVARWVARVWRAQPTGRAGHAEPADLPARLQPLLERVCKAYLPYLQANARAHARGARQVEWQLQGVPMSTPVSPYRVWCLQELARRLHALAPADAGRVAVWLSTLGGPCGVQALQTLRASLAVPGSAHPFPPLQDAHP